MKANISHFLSIKWK